MQELLVTEEVISVVTIIIITDCFYIVPFSALGHTHSALVTYDSK